MVKKDSDKYNYGLALLRIWMCFEVIQDHFMKWEVSNKYELGQPYRLIYEYGNVAVPVFMIMSFMFTGISDIASDREKIKRRLARLLLPYLFWNLIYYIVYAFIGLIKPESGLDYGLKDVVSQFLFGSVYNATLWFQVEIIVISIIFILIYRFLNKSIANGIIIAGAAISLAVQYNGFLGKLYITDYTQTIIGKLFNPSDYVFTFFRFFEVFPMAVLGLAIVGRGLFKECDIRRRIMRIVVIMLLLKFFRNTQFFVLPNGFGYGGCSIISYSAMYNLFVLLLTFGYAAEYCKKRYQNSCEYNNGDILYA